MGSSITFATLIAFVALLLSIFNTISAVRERKSKRRSEAQRTAARVQIRVLDGKPAVFNGTGDMIRKVTVFHLQLLLPGPADGVDIQAGAEHEWPPVAFGVVPKVDDLTVEWLHGAETWQREGTGPPECSSGEF